MVHVQTFEERFLFSTGFLLCFASTSFLSAIFHSLPAYHSIFRSQKNSSQSLITYIESAILFWNSLLRVILFQLEKQGEKSACLSSSLSPFSFSPSLPLSLPHSLPFSPISFFLSFLPKAFNWLFTFEFNFQKFTHCNFIWLYTHSRSIHRTWLGSLGLMNLARYCIIQTCSSDAVGKTRYRESEHLWSSLKLSRV